MIAKVPSVLLVAAVCCTALGPAGRGEARPHAPAAASPPEIAAIHLPQGRQLEVSVGPASVTFLDLDRQSKAYNVADVWVLTILQPPVMIGTGLAAQVVRHVGVDCTWRVWRDLGSKGFDAAGVMVLSQSGGASAQIQAGEAMDLIADRVCEGAKPASETVVTGHAAALKLAKAILKQAG